MNTSAAAPSPALWHSVQDLLFEEHGDPVAAVRDGLPVAVFERVRAVLAAPDALLARVLAVSERTLHRRKGQGRLTPAESDRLLLLAGVVRLAARAFDDLPAARAWLRSPHALLGGESPLEHMDTVAGIHEVQSMLYHVEYSMPV